MENTNNGTVTISLARYKELEKIELDFEKETTEFKSKIKSNDETWQERYDKLSEKLDDEILRHSREHREIAVRLAHGRIESAKILNEETIAQLKVKEAKVQAELLSDIDELTKNVNELKSNITVLEEKVVKSGLIWFAIGVIIASVIAATF